MENIVRKPVSDEIVNDLVKLVDARLDEYVKECDRMLDLNPSRSYSPVADLCVDVYYEWLGGRDISEFERGIPGRVLNKMKILRGVE